MPRTGKFFWLNTTAKDNPTNPNPIIATFNNTSNYLWIKNNTNEK